MRRGRPPADGTPDTSRSSARPPLRRCRSRRSEALRRFDRLGDTARSPDPPYPRRTRVYSGPHTRRLQTHTRSTKRHTEIDHTEEHKVTEHVEALLTPVALRLVTVHTVFVLTGNTRHRLVHAVRRIGTGFKTVRPKPDKHSTGHFLLLQAM